jgi:hypothetical protein
LLSTVKDDIEAKPYHLNKSWQVLVLRWVLRATVNTKASFYSDCKTWHDFTMFIDNDYFEIEIDRAWVIKIIIIRLLRELFL